MIRKQGHTFEPITIGQDVWIDADVTVLQGVIIGDGDAPGSDVIANVQEFTLVAGVPAKKIGER